MKIKPLGHHIFVKSEKSREQVGSIVLPDNSQFAQRIGTVIATGPGIWRGDTFVPIELKPGDKVVFGTYSGQRLKFIEEENGEIKETEYYHMREDEIYGIIEDADKIIGVEDVYE